MPHTHWDREWHVPFQAGRVRLARLLDSVLDDLEAGRLACFWLDGQTAAIDDYLAVRPGALDRVRAAVEGGRLGIGPWAVPMDEFVVSPETIVRNLDAGLRRRAELGAPGRAVGYVPDIFGHIAQLPQLLRLAGIDHAVVWRGVPAAIATRTTAFRWEAPDGSCVRTEYLFGSYANGRTLPADGAGLVERARSWEHEVGRRRVAGLLLMNGGDQRPAESWVTAAAAEANDDGRYRFEVVDLGAWLEAERAAVPDDDLPSWRGELRSSAAAPVLGGVISNRVDVRAAAAAAERAVERRAEPLLALFRPAAEWAAAAPLLDIAWDRLIANSAHDSACACCSDAVAGQVVVRYAEAGQIGAALAGQVLADVAAETGTGPVDVLVVNTRPATRAGVVEVTVPAGGDLGEPFTGADGLPRAVQVLGVERRELFAARVAGDKVGWVADRIAGGTFDGGPVRAWSLEDATLVFEEAGPDDEAVDLTAAREALLALGAAGSEAVAVRLQGAPQRRVLVETGPVAGFGWTVLRRPSGAVEPVEPAAPPVRVQASPLGATVLDNGIVRVEVDPAHGTFAVRTDAGLGVAGLNRYVDGGDGGDTYTWCPPETDAIIDRPDAVGVAIAEPGPLRGRVVITASYRWPVAAEGDEQACTHRSAVTAEVEIVTSVALVAGDPVVAVETTLDHHTRDHRLRVHFPLPAPVTGSDAGCAFAVVHRGLDVEGGPAETPPPTFPARRFVDCSGDGRGLGVFADGAFEYEVTGGGTELAVTLLRATGWLSRRRLPLRPDPAGPPVAVEGAQVPGRRRWRYGVLLHSGDWEQAHVAGRADAFLNPFEAVAGAAGATARRPSAGQALRVDGAEVSAVLRDADGVSVRLFNPGSQLLPARVGSEDVPLRPGQIATVRTGRRPRAG